MPKVINIGTFRRSLAAKKGWRTRRLIHYRRSLAAKKGWRTRRQIHLRRSLAAKRGWRTHRARIAAKSQRAFTRAEAEEMFEAFGDEEISEGAEFDFGEDVDVSP